MKLARAVFGNQTRMSNPNPQGIPQGTPGGKKYAAGMRPGMKLNAGDEIYLWILLALELAATAFLRRKFRRYHGG